MMFYYNSVLNENKRVGIIIRAAASLLAKYKKRKANSNASIVGENLLFIIISCNY